MIKFQHVFQALSSGSSFFVKSERSFSQDFIWHALVCSQHSKLPSFKLMPAQIPIIDSVDTADLIPGQSVHEFNCGSFQSRGVYT